MLVKLRAQLYDTVPVVKAQYNTLNQLRGYIPVNFLQTCLGVDLEIQINEHKDLEKDRYTQRGNI